MPTESQFSQPKREDRPAILQRQQQLKMARSAHAYVRGNTAKFYEWLEQAKGTVPQGPPIWICGDCHVGNLGPVAGVDGKVEIEIRDLDQTTIGNPAHDLIRLGLSLAMAARGSDLSGVTTALMLEQMMLGYVDAMRGPRRTQKAPKKSAKPVQSVLKEAVSREWRHLAKERIEDVRPEIPLGPKFWALSGDEKEELKQLFKANDVRELITCLRERSKHDKVKIRDAAYWMKGCSSLGRLRYAVLLGVGKEFCLIDIKEAASTAAPGYDAADMPSNHAQRLVAGARAISPFLGERMLATKFAGRPVVLRELRPQDLKIELDRITRDEAVAAARFLAGVVGRAHARQMDATTRRKWVLRLKEHRSKVHNAPHWLWTSVVELVGNHEIAYLEHCRQFAAATAYHLPIHGRLPRDERNSIQ